VDDRAGDDLPRLVIPCRPETWEAHERCRVEGGADRGEIRPTRQVRGGGGKNVSPVRGGADRPARTRPREGGVGDGAGLDCCVGGQDRREEAVVWPDEDIHPRHAERERPLRRADTRIDDRDVGAPWRAVGMGGGEQKRPFADRLWGDLVGQVDDRRVGTPGQDHAVHGPDVDPASPKSVSKVIVGRIGSHPPRVVVPARHAPVRGARRSPAQSVGRYGRMQQGRLFISRPCCSVRLSRTPGAASILGRRGRSPSPGRGARDRGASRDRDVARPAASAGGATAPRPRGIWPRVPVPGPDRSGRWCR